MAMLDRMKNGETMLLMPFDLTGEVSMSSGQWAVGSGQWAVSRWAVVHTAMDVASRDSYFDRVLTLLLNSAFLSTASCPYCSLPTAY